MCFTHFVLSQNGQSIGDVTDKKQAVSAAVRHAADTGRPVTVTAYIDGGGSQEVIFNPDGTNEKIWLIDKGKPLVPVFWQVYTNRGGGRFRCLGRMPDTSATYYNPYGGSSSTSGIFQNIKSGWTFVAKGIIQYIDGTIEWDHSTNGQFKDIAKGG